MTGPAEQVHPSFNTSKYVDSTTKRLFDLVLAAALMLPAIIICAICVMVIWVECRTNPFFVQTRVGKHRRPFKLIKVRTMAPNTSDLPTHEVERVSVLKSGRVLRALKLDELPQVWNVLSGAMSFVGPRPCLPSQSELVEARDLRGLYSIRPGLTGPAQLAGIDMSTPQALAEADSRYLRSASITEDVRILARTFVGGGVGDRVR